MTEDKSMRQLKSSNPVKNSDLFYHFLKQYFGHFLTVKASLFW